MRFAYDRILMNFAYTMISSHQAHMPDPGQMGATCELPLELAPG